MDHFGGGMPCVHQIRGDGVAPIPVPDAREQAHKSGPKTRRLHHHFSAGGQSSGQKRAGFGVEPQGFRARSARSSS